MGQYLFTGPCTRIRVRKEPHLDDDSVFDQLSTTVDLSLFERGDEQHFYTWSLKPRYLEDGFVDFVEKQYEIYGLNNYNAQTLATLRKAGSAQDVLNLAEEGSHYLWLIDFSDHFSVGRHRVQVYFQMLAIFMDGKVILECYDNLFHYLEWNMRLQREKYPIAGAMKITIDG